VAPSAGSTRELRRHSGEFDGDDESPAGAAQHRRSARSRRRIHIAAAKRDKSIREYVWEAVEARLKHDLADELSSADLATLHERTDPVFAALWSNPKDAAYDKL